MDNLKTNLKVLLDKDVPRDSYKYEELLNAEMIGVSSPMTPSMDRPRTDIEMADMANPESVKQTAKPEMFKVADENPFEDVRDSFDGTPMIENNEVDQVMEQDPISNRPFSLLKVSFFSLRFRNDMKKLIKQFLLIYSLMLLLIVAIGSIFYGTMYNRGHYLHNNIKVDVVNEDVQIGVMKPYVGDCLEFVTRNDHSLNSKVKFAYPKASEVILGNLTIQESLRQRIKEKKAWAYVYVRANASHDLYTDLKRPSNSPAFDKSNVIHFYYESSRDQKIVKSFLEPVLASIDRLYQQEFQGRVMMPLISDWLDTKEQISLLTDHKNTMLQNIHIEYVDVKPFMDPVFAAQTSVGLVMMIIVSFFQFHFFMPIHSIVFSKIQSRHYVYYRMISSQVSYFFLGLGFTALFHIFSKEKLYFLVFWLVTYLTISAVGGMNENMAMILFSTYSPLVGFWLLFWVILNIAPAFNLIETLPLFYRYGYALPIYNYLGCINVIILDSWSGALLRNLLVLVAWVAFNNLIFPFTLRFFTYRMDLKMRGDAE